MTRIAVVTEEDWSWVYMPPLGWFADPFDGGRS